MSGVRDRFRMQMQQEVKDAAVRQLADGGPQALSINAIAKELGVSGPALYRYFAGRDDLLTALILDAYRDMTEVLSRATAAEQAPAQRLAGLATAYRGWATAQPHRYRLLFTAPLPGYDAHDTLLVDAAQRMMNVVLDVLNDFPRESSTPGGALEGQLAAWARTRTTADVDPATALIGVTLWSRLHGMVSLEIERNFASMGLDADLVFTNEVASFVHLASERHTK